MEPSGAALTGLVIHRCQVIAVGDDWSAVISIEVTGPHSLAIVGRKVGVFYLGQLVGQGHTDEWGYVTIATHPLPTPSPRQAPQSLQVRHQEPLFIASTDPFEVPPLPREVNRGGASAVEVDRLPLPQVEARKEEQPPRVERAVFRRCDLSDMNGRSAQLKYAILEHCDLQRADFTGADLRYADLRGANLTDAKLCQANLQGATLRHANLQRADLTDANLQGAEMQGADLSGATIAGVCWDEADLSAIQGVDLSRIPARRLKLSAKQYQEIQQAEVARQEEERRKLDAVKSITPRLAQLSALHHLGDYILIPPGAFMMGSVEDGGPLSVTLSQPFWLKTTPVTQAEWRAIMGDNPSHFQGRNLYPVESILWDDAARYCQAVSKLTQLHFHLPTEAQWEYACRAGAPAADEAGIDDVAWYSANAQGRTHRVASKRPNAWGLYDTLGHVWEWCQDWHGAYPTQPQRDPQGPATGTYRVIRGGAWSVLPRYCRPTQRGSANPNTRANNFGFRPAVSITL
jgi:formylglycine-generating enzyme required for sulfatase activity